MTKWKCGICGSNFENFHAQGFNNKIYCPLCYFKKENQELKKQLKNSIKVNMADHKYASECEDKVVTLEAHQKRFVKWLENKIHTIETTYSQINGNYGLMNEKLEALKEILRKYKSIIGVSDDNKTDV